MNQKEIRKNIKSFSKYYRNALINEGMDDIEKRMSLYETRLKEMYNSENYAKHNIYPSTNVSFVYAVIAMCLELKDAGFEDERIIRAVEKGMEGRWNAFVKILKFIDLFPNCFSIVRKWNDSDHASRVKDGSITYDYFSSEKDKVEYSISKCMYVEMFSSYGIRPLCKIFCNTDLIAYSGLTRHVKFVRHSDLSDGCACFDEVIKKKKL
ncbi:MAG: L-2-amino-thiazoline-4-carboxylic acid hydrolase [Erysipelotrichaceae bacterium]|nr:L-2-amino-thiazoline-4-carboxylic acid hydrolase [Erysipelotrichaceae bacterium]